MHCTLNKKEIVTKATITIALDTEEEIQAFKTILTLGEAEVYRQSHGYNLKLEQQIIKKLRESFQ